jgi:hypothetical protein
MASSRPWPFDDEDRPSGSVRPLSQADLQAILAHLSDDPEELLASTGADRPVVAVRVRATVGRPGGSAQARGRRMRAAEWAVWVRTLPWRIAVILGIGAGHLVVEHDGLVPGFSSQLSVAPDDGVGVVAFTNGARSAKAWLGAEVAGMLRDLLGVADEMIRTDVPHHPEIWRDLCGWYSFCGSFRDVQKWFIAGAEVSV